MKKKQEEQRDKAKRLAAAKKEKKQKPKQKEVGNISYRPVRMFIMDSPDEELDEKRENRELSADEDIYVADGPHQTIREILDWIFYILLAIILGLLISRYVMQRSIVVGESMETTLSEGDQLLVDKLSLNFTDPDYGDIVTVRANGLSNTYKDELIVKRVIAKPHDTIDFKDGEVILNSKVLEEDYLADTVKTYAPNWEGPLTLKDDEYFVLGDNRGNSTDSRFIGPVKKEDIVGSIWIQIYPLDEFGKVD